MPQHRSTVLANSEYYHIFNRGVAKAPTFLTTRDFRQALQAISYYRIAHPPFALSRTKEIARTIRDDLFRSLLTSTDKLVEIVCFVLMPNHFHFLLMQRQENGISKFVSQLTNSYTRYFNTVHDRTGPLYQGVFKSVHVETDEQLLHLSRYIHLNPVTAYLISKNEVLTYPWSSLPQYFTNDPTFLAKSVILEAFPSPQKYYDFLLDQIDYARHLEAIKHLTLED